MATDDQGAVPRYRRPTREMAPAPTADAHVVWCWEGAGPGARLRLHVDQVENNMSQQIDGVAKEARGEILAINKRIWYLNGGLGLLVLLVPIVLGFWLNSRLKTTEGAAFKRQDVESAIQRSVEMVANKQFDDAVLIKQMLDQAKVQVAPPTVSPVQTRAQK